MIVKQEFEDDWEYMSASTGPTEKLDNLRITVVGQIRPKPGVRCEYCNRLNYGKEKSVCDGCGAPL